MAEGLTCAAWGPDGSVLAMAAEDRLLVWHAQGHQLEAAITSQACPELCCNGIGAFECSTAAHCSMQQAWCRLINVAGLLHEPVLQSPKRPFCITLHQPQTIARRSDKALQQAQACIRLLHHHRC